MQRHSLVSLYDFENWEKVFPGIHRQIKFCLLTVSGATRPQESSQFAFFLHQAGQISDAHWRVELSGDDFKLFNPNTRTCPMFRAQRDMEIARKMYRRAGVLWREAKNGELESNPWGAGFLSMFHMSGDSGWLYTRKELEPEGWQLQGNEFVRGDARYVPLYEAKLFHQYGHRHATFDSARVDSIKNGNATGIGQEMKRDPNAVVIPHYWVSENEVAKRLARER